MSYVIAIYICVSYTHLVATTF